MWAAESYGDASVIQPEFTGICEKNFNGKLGKVQADAGAALARAGSTTARSGARAGAVGREAGSDCN